MKTILALHYFFCFIKKKLNQLILQRYTIIQLILVYIKHF